ncbi:EF-hand calcium-binding domain-containing protein 4A isoform X2 [Alosa sapidissima]|uniref:EF-hand calcium-binding domain-containing protein 4A isoform X2 n=1 Tax=Alosa sapidissima TaxID=34773 RepID=UPI001C086501|nr:EF-hand calcium-binding domain-containing protein 4A isoform X2 [Alosa sapidissima]
MSAWVGDGVVLEGEGSGVTSPSPILSPRLRGQKRSSSSSSSSLRRRGGLASPGGWEAPQQQHSMDKATELFELCDKEGKGFITKRDMQRLQGELPLSPDQLESVFESLDKDSNGFLTPVEFHTGLGELVGEQETEPELEPEMAHTEPSAAASERKVDPRELRFTQTLAELGADTVFADHWELCSLWSGLQRERPELLKLLEEVLSQALAHLQDSVRERDTLEQALRRREHEHDREVRSIYEDMESQIREEREKRIAQDSMKPVNRSEQLLEELAMREQELEFALTKQRELESRIASMRAEQAATREQNQRLHNLNKQLQEHLDTNRDELQTALHQLELLQTSVNQHTQGRERVVLKVSRNMQRERESLTRQLDMLRDMNKRLRDEKDAHQSQKRMCGTEKRPLEKKGSVIGDYMQLRETATRQLTSANEGSDSFVDRLAEARDTRATANERAAIADGCSDSGESLSPTGPRVSSPQRVFKVVFLGNSGVGKSSFIHHCCQGNFPNNLSSTVGIDFQVRSVQLESSSIALQLWDTAGQERFHSITQQYYRKADGILAVYDITSAPSLRSLTGWLDQVQERVAEGAVLMLLGNKSDMAEREVPQTEGQKVAERYQAEFFECSAKSGHNVVESMTRLARLLAQQQDRQCDSALLLDSQSTPRGRCCK